MWKDSELAVEYWTAKGRFVVLGDRVFRKAAEGWKLIRSGPNGWCIVASLTGAKCVLMHALTVDLDSGR